MIRGIATTVYARPTRRVAHRATPAPCSSAPTPDEPFVRVLPEGATPSLSSVRGSNFCDVTALVDERTGLLVLLSTLDNLVKGASGQAVQCLNLMRGWPETEGLREAPLVP